MNQIESQMKQLRLHGMVKSWAALQESRQLHNLSLQEGMEILIQSEEQERNNRRFKRLEYNAAFRYKASIEELFQGDTTSTAQERAETEESLRNDYKALQDLCKNLRGNPLDQFVKDKEFLNAANNLIVVKQKREAALADQKKIERAELRVPNHGRSLRLPTERVSNRSQY